MYNYKRVTLLCGHYGSGKTNVAVNMAFDLAKKGKKAAVADLDIEHDGVASRRQLLAHDRRGDQSEIIDRRGHVT